VYRLPSSLLDAISKFKLPFVFLIFSPLKDLQCTLQPKFLLVKRLRSVLDTGSMHSETQHCTVTIVLREYDSFGIESIETNTVPYSAHN
jgi:hypothetical protein